MLVGHTHFTIVEEKKMDQVDEVLTPAELLETAEKL